MPSKDSPEMFPSRPGLIAPAAGIGDNLLVVRQNAYHLYRVTYREGLPPSTGLIRDFGVIAAGASSLDVSLQVQLEMNDNEIGQFRAFVLDDIRVTLKEPRSVSRFTTKNIVATLSLWTHQVDPCDHLTEFFAFEDEWPFADVLNPTAGALAQTRIAFYGFRYVVENIGRFMSLSEVKQPYMGVAAQGTFAGPTPQL